MRVGEPQAARVDAEAALALNPHSAEAWRLIGAASRMTGEVRGAIAAYDRAIALSPTHAVAWRDRGETRLLAGDASGALADLDAAIERAPADAEALAFRGFAHFARGYYAAAVRDFDVCAELRFPYVYLPLWRALARQYDRRDWRDFLRAEAERYAADEWPAPLMRAVLGDGTLPRDVEARAKLYLGAFALGERKRQIAQPLIEAARREAPADSVERWMAGVLLAR